jgi:regulator of MON1-CCZ1 complex
MEDNNYLFLSENNYLKFDPVSQITNVFFDDTKKQIFIVKSAAVSVQSLEENRSFSFLIESSPLIAIKFNANDSILAIQRTENSLELHSFKNNQLLGNSTIFYETKKTIIFGFFWSQPNEFVVVTSDNVELFQVNTSKRTMKSLKSITVSSNWFAWNRSNFALLSSNNGMLLTPILLLKPGTLTKLASIQIDDGPGVTERDVVPGILYGTPSILILRTTKMRALEIWVYLLEGPSFRRTHILKLGFSGRVAISIIDSIIIVHHQTSKVSLLFDIAINGEIVDSLKVHTALVPGKSIKPFAIKIPSVSLKENSMNVELYSANWVIFQPDIIIDVKLGYLFKLNLAIEKIQIGDKIKLVDFLLHREKEKPQLLSVLTQLVSPDDVSESIHLPVLEVIFDKLNKIYKQKLDFDLLKMQALPTTTFLPSPSTFKSFSTPVPAPPQMPSEIVIEQGDMLQIFNTIIDKNIQEKVLMVYLFSIVKHSISCEYDLSKLLVVTLIGSQKIQDLQQILSYNVLHESKPLACFLLSLTNHHPLISQMALDMLRRLNAHEIIVEILLEQGKVIDAIRLAKQYTNTDLIPARKFLEAAWKSEEKMIFYSVYNFFISRNQRLRGNSDFIKSKFYWLS